MACVILFICQIVTDMTLYDVSGGLSDPVYLPDLSIYFLLMARSHAIITPGSANLEFEEKIITN